jgi:hypothetical protein
MKHTICTISDEDLEEKADKLMGNFLKWTSYISGLTDAPPPEGGYSRREYVPDLDKWTIHYTNHGNQSTIVDDSNSAVYAKELAPFTEGDDPDVVPYSASCSMVGHLDGYRVRVRNAKGEITGAFRVLAELMQIEEESAYLDPDDHSERSMDATTENIADIGSRWAAEGAPSDWPGAVHHWLSANGYENQLEDTDDQGGYPSRECVQEAMIALGVIDELHGLNHGTAAYGRMIRRIRGNARKAYLSDKKREHRRALSLPTYRSRWPEGSRKVEPVKMSYRRLNKKAARKAVKATSYHFRYDWGV